MKPRMLLYPFPLAQLILRFLDWVCEVTPPVGNPTVGRIRIYLEPLGLAAERERLEGLGFPQKGCFY